MISGNLAVDIGSSYIKIICGNGRKVKFCGLVKTPDGSAKDGSINDITKVRETIENFLNQNNIKASNISYTINGQDMVIRHTVIPIMEKSNIEKTIEWEMGQYLPENGLNYYISYEIIEKINTKEKKACKVLAAAAPKAKIDKYVELTEALRLKLKAIDVNANCISRVFGHNSKSHKEKENIAIIDIGYKSSSITILDRGKLFIEKEISFGIEDAVGIVSKKLNINHEEAYTYLFEGMNISSIDQNNDAQLGVQILFEDAFSTFEKVIQFYSSENLQQKIDKVYITGGGSELLGIDVYANNYMNLPVLMIDQSLLDSIGIKIPDNCDVNIYINTIGLMLRKE